MLEFEFPFNSKQNPANKRLQINRTQPTFTSAIKIMQNPLWLWNPEKTSLEIQNRGISGPQKGRLSAKNFY